MRNLDTCELNQVTGALCFWPFQECTDDEKMYTGKFLHMLSLGLSVGLAAGGIMSPVGYQFQSMVVGAIVGGFLVPAITMSDIN